MMMGQEGRTIEYAVEWYRKKISDAYPRLNTEKAKKIAEKRKKEVVEFFDGLEEELQKSSHFLSK